MRHGWAHAGILPGFAVGLCLAGCVSYAPLPLDTAPDLASNLSSLSASPAGPGARLGMQDVALLAVANNPDLRAARLGKGLAAAQIYQAGLLPDPQLTGTYGFLLGGPGTADAYSFGLAEDVRALILRDSMQKTAAANAKQIEWDLVWQEWQTASKAALLYIDMISQARLKRAVQVTQDLVQKRYDLDMAAEARGDATIVVTAPEAVALADLNRQLHDIDRQALARDHDLKALLGLAPGADLPLVDKLDVPAIAPAEIRAALDTLPQRRPDLKGLAAAYDAQEEKTWGAVLGQFPALVLGGQYGSDTTSVLSGGPAVSMDLPVFNRNRGNIAIEQATRAKLHDEYTARLNAAYSEAHAMQAGIALIENQLAQLRPDLPRRRAARDNAEKAFAQGNIDIRTYADIISADLTAESETIALQQALAEDRAALVILLGTPEAQPDPMP